MLQKGLPGHRRRDRGDVAVADERPPELHRHHAKCGPPTSSRYGRDVDRRRATIVTLGVVIVVGLALAAARAWRPHDVDVVVEGGGRGLSRTERRAVEEVAEMAFHDARLALPMLPRRLSLSIWFGKSVIPETGENGTFVLPAEIAWTVDPDRDLLAVTQTQLRGSLLHELHHLARAARVPTTSLMDRVVMEGLATAFERDVAKGDPPWGKAPPEALEWTRELLAQPPTGSADQWLGRHPDGRRWIGMRAGTFIADRAMEASGKTAAELVATPTEEILRLAHVR